MAATEVKTIEELYKYLNSDRLTYMYIYADINSEMDVVKKTLNELQVKIAEICDIVFVDLLIFEEQLTKIFAESNFQLPGVILMKNGEMLGFIGSGAANKDDYEMMFREALQFLVHHEQEDTSSNNIGELDTKTDNLQDNKMSESHRDMVVEILENSGLEVFNTKHRVGKVYKTKHYTIDMSKHIPEQIQNLIREYDVAFLFAVYSSEESRTDMIKQLNLSDGEIKNIDMSEDFPTLNILMDLQ